MLLVLTLASCKEEVEIKNSLSVSPGKALEFKATGNEDVVLTVTTDAEKWSYTASEWIIAKQDGNTLIINVADNNGDSRAGNIKFNAGTADEVKINVLQHNSENGNEIEDGKIAASIKDENGKSDVRSFFDDKTNKITLKLKLTLSEALQSDANISVFMDKDYLDEYNYANYSSCVYLPDNSLSSYEWPVTISAGSKEAEISIEVNCTDLVYATNYLLPLKANIVNDDVTFPNKDSRVNYVISKTKQKEVKQMCIMEFNNANPLNVLEYKLQDGSYFFDALVLFSGNIAWDADADAVRFNARTGEPVINYNTAALIEEWKTYIKPIHDAGIKVYMGIMPHHTAAGITTLSQNGCKWFAEEMAQIIKDCQLDGVFLDEEYRGNHGGPMSSEWASDIITDGSYFAFQMAKQMDLVCDWPTDVVVFQLEDLAGCRLWGRVTDHEDASFQLPVEEYADIFVGNYGYVAYPTESGVGLTNENCTGCSVELTKPYYNLEDDAIKVMEGNYGWMMYFAFNPDPTSVYNNKEKAMKFFNDAARVCYGQELMVPTHYYRWIGEGQYDPTRYEY